MSFHELTFEQVIVASCIGLTVIAVLAMFAAESAYHKARTLAERCMWDAECADAKLMAAEHQLTIERERRVAADEKCRGQAVLMAEVRERLRLALKAAIQAAAK